MSPFGRARRRAAVGAALLTVAAGGLAGCGGSGSGGPSGRVDSPGRPAAHRTATPPAFVAPDQPGPFRVGRITLAVPETLPAAAAGTPSGAASPSPAAPSPAAPSPAAPSPATAGPAPAASGTPVRRMLTVDVWYPVDPAAAAGHPVARYEVSPGVSYPSATALEGAPLSRSGPFPLVAYSHGSAGVSFQSAFVTEALASHGFVVAAPDHIGDTQGEVAAGHQASLVDLATTRQLDISATITDVLRRSAATSGPLAGAVDPARIGALGFSFGGLTVLVMPTGFLSAPADPRIRAVVALAPAAQLVPLATLAGNRIPTLVIDASGDTVAPAKLNAIPQWGALAGRPKYRVDLTGAAHNTFSDLCTEAAAIKGRPVPKDLGLRISLGAGITCHQPGISYAAAHRVTTLFTVAFLSARLYGDHRYDRYLTPAYAHTLPDLTFTAQP